MRFVAQDFFYDLFPCTYVGANITDCFSVNLDVDWRVRWTVENGVEGYILAQSMREEEACNYAFVDNVESSCVVQVAKIWVGSALA